MNAKVLIPKFGASDCKKTVRAIFCMLEMRLLSAKFVFCLKESLVKTALF